MVTLLTDLCFSGATFLHNTVDVNKSVWGALNSPFILFDIFHLSFYNACVNMWWNCLTLKTLHKLSILNVNALSLFLFIYEVQGAFLFKRMRAVNDCARTHIGLKQRLVWQNVVQVVDVTVVTVCSLLENVAFLSLRLALWKKHCLMCIIVSQELCCADTFPIQFSCLRCNWVRIYVCAWIVHCQKHLEIVSVVFNWVYRPLWGWSLH